VPMPSLFVVVLKPQAGGKQREFYESECACWTMAASAALKAIPGMVVESVYQDPVSVAGICVRCGQFQERFPKPSTPVCRDCQR
jgi:hypothetical protein